MGCDIHLYAEVYNEGINEWEICAPSNYKNYGSDFEVSPWVFEYNDYQAVRKGKAEGWLFVWDEKTDWLKMAQDSAKEYRDSGYEDEPEIDVRLMDWDVGRDYSLFFSLAGVRGGWGSNGDPIDYPRGLPSNCSEECQHESDRMDSDGHSHSYMTADEIIENLDKDEFEHMYNHAVELKEKAGGNGKNGRFVFFFDN
jgi:hypothetical protein